MRVLRLAVVVLLALSAHAAAQTLTLGIKTEPNGLDPHLHNAPPGHQVNRHLFDRLVDLGPDGTPRPALAASWEQEAEDVLVLRLRPGVRFHDGTPFRAEDVAATVRRIPGVLNNVGPFLPYIRALRDVEVRDDATVALRTNGPSPSLLANLAFVSIVPASQAGQPSDAFNTGSAAIGTGPYRLVRHARGEVTELRRNDAWWGGPTAWETVRLRYIPNDAVRLSALIAGELDLINALSPQDIEAVGRQPRLQVFSAPTFRVVHLSFDQFRERTLHATTAEGAALPANPFRDVRVRQALSLTVPRAAIVERVMEGHGAPVAQMASPGTFGAAPDLPVPAPDVGAARRLLEEAGYGGGFTLVLHAPSDFIPRGPQMAQAVAASWSRLGLRVSVATNPTSVHFPGARGTGEGPQWSAWLTSWGNNGGDSIDALQSLLHSADAARGLGAQNVSRSSVPEADALIARALTTLDRAERERLQQEAMRLQMRVHVQAPILAQAGLFAGRRDLSYAPNPQEHLHAQEVRPVR